MYRSLDARTKETADFVKRLYLRLAPAFFTAVLIFMAAGLVKARYLADVTLLLPGLSLPGDITGWGDWYVGVYFWCMIGYFLLLKETVRLRWLWVLILVYFCASVKFNAPLEYGLDKNVNLGLSGNYFGWFGVSVARGTLSIGIGILTGAVYKYLSLKRTAFVFWAQSALEFVLSFLLLEYIIRRNHLNSLQIQIVFAMLLLCMVRGGGRLSDLLNKSIGIVRVSKYTYALFIMQIVAMKFLRQWGGDWSAWRSVFFAFGLTAVLAVAQYHLVERKLAPYFVRLLGQNTRS